MRLLPRTVFFGPKPLPSPGLFINTELRQGSKIRASHSDNHPKGFGVCLWLKGHLQLGHFFWK